MQWDENLLYINNKQQIDAIHMGYRQTGGGLHPPIWSNGHLSRPDADQIQDLNWF